MLLPLLFSVSAWAFPVLLPDGSDTASWERSLALVGLWAGTPGDETGAQIVAESERWIVELVVAGRVDRVVVVAPPASREDREAIVFMIDSLLRPTGALSVPPATSPATEPVPPAVPTPDQQSGSEAIVEPEARPEPQRLPPRNWKLEVQPKPGAASGTADGSREDAVVDLAERADEPPPARARPSGWSAGGGLLLRLQDRVGPSGGALAWLGWSPHADGLRLDIEADVGSRSSFGDQRRVFRIDAMLRPGWKWGGSEPGVLVGLSSRRFTSEDDASFAEQATVPIVGAGLRQWVRVGRLPTRFGVHTRVDLVPIDVVVGEVTRERFPEFVLGLDIGVGRR